MREALALIIQRAPDLEVEGEMHGDAALSAEVRSVAFPNHGSRRGQPAHHAHARCRQHLLQCAQDRRGRRITIGPSCSALPSLCISSPYRDSAQDHKHGLRLPWWMPWHNANRNPLRVDDRFDYLLIAPRDFDASLRFYRDVMKWESQASEIQGRRARRGAFWSGIEVILVERHKDGEYSILSGVNGAKPTLHLDIHDVEKRFELVPRATTWLSRLRIRTGACAGLCSRIPTAISSPSTNEGKRVSRTGSPSAPA